MQFEIGQLAPQPALVEREHTGLVASGLLPHTSELADTGWHVDHRETSNAGHWLCKGRVRTFEFDSGLVRPQPVPEPPIDRRLRGIQRGQRLAALVHVIELAPHHGCQQATPAMGREHADTRDAPAPQRAARHRHLIAEDAGGRDHLLAIEKCQGAVELGDLPRDRQLLVSWKRLTKGAPHQRRIGSLLLLVDRPELEPLGRAYR